MKPVNENQQVYPPKKGAHMSHEALFCEQQTIYSAIAFIVDDVAE